MLAKYNKNREKHQIQQEKEGNPKTTPIYNTSLRNSCNLREIADGRLLAGDASASPGWLPLFSPIEPVKKIRRLSIKKRPVFHQFPSDLAGRQETACARWGLPAVAR